MRTPVLITTIICVNAVLFAAFLLLKHYPPFLMLLHIISLVFLWGILFKDMQLISLIKTKRKELLLIGILVLAAFFVRLDRIEELTPGMYADEVTVANWGLRFLAESDMPPFVSVSYYHPTPLLYLTGMSAQAFGHTMTAIRLPNVIMGSLSVGIFFILLRLFFPLPLAFFGSFLMIFQYIHVVLSRLAYEPIPSLLWQMLSAIFFTLYWRTRNRLYLVGLALALGGGMYTYLNFRPFAAIIFLLTAVAILKTNWRKQMRTFGLFVVLVFTATMPLISYAILDPHGFSGRVSDISIFSYRYSSAEFMKELGGNITRTGLLPFIAIIPSDPKSPPMSGDPNPSHNPARAAFFDFTTVLLAIGGFIYLFAKKRSLFWFMLIMLVPAFLSDIFSVEVIPEGHYYGLGHPHALRASGFIWVILFAATACLNWIYSRWGKEKKAEVLTTIILLVAIISYWNWHLYFDQKQISPDFFIYNYIYSHARETDTAKYLKTVHGNTIQIATDPTGYAYLSFFLDPTKKISRFDPTTAESTMETIKKNDVTIIDITKQSVPILKDLNPNVLTSMGYDIQALNNPLGKPAVIIFVRNNSFLPN